MRKKQYLCKTFWFSHANKKVHSINFSSIFMRSSALDTGGEDGDRSAEEQSGVRCDPDAELAARVPLGA